MNPGIFYLYEYNNTQKLRNVGFLKLTRYYHSCTLQLNARAVPVTYADTLKLCAFYLENDTVGATILAEVPCTNHMVSARLNFAECQFPDGHTLNTMDGFFLPLSNGCVLAATVPGILVDTKKLLSASNNLANSKNQSGDAESSPKAQKANSSDNEAVPEIQNVKPNLNETAAPEVQDTKPVHNKDNTAERKDAKLDHDEVAAPKMQNANPTSNQGVPQMHDVNPDSKEAVLKTQEVTPNSTEIIPDAQKSISAKASDPDTINPNSRISALYDEVPLPSIIDAEPDRKDITSSIGSAAANGDTIAPNISETAPTCEDISEDNSNEKPTQDTPQQTVRKIQRSDMSDLPRCYWHLANNSFLLHGYHNYSHLLLVEKDGHYWLGVPGIYDSREARAARLFGFPQFTDSYNEQMNLSDEEQNSHGKFGYWCCYLK